MSEYDSCETIFIIEMISFHPLIETTHNIQILCFCNLCSYVSHIEVCFGPTNPPIFGGKVLIVSNSDNETNKLITKL